MSIVSEVLESYLPASKKVTPSGWISFNAPCCIHNGETVDKKGRGGIIKEGDVVSYHCFNCGYKTGWQPGRHISYKLKKLMEWLNIPDDVINKLSLEVLKINDESVPAEHILKLPEFHTVQLPEGSRLIEDDPCDESLALSKVKEYMSSRELWVDQDCKYYWSSDFKFRNRFIIPFTYQGRIVGYTARAVDGNQYKYLTSSQPGYVFGLDEQRPQKLFAIVCEGPIDAQYIEGCALLGSEINEQQAFLLNRLNKDIIVVPDRDSKGKQLAEQAMELGWQVSMPEWDLSINDIGDAVLKYGRLYTLYSIVSAAESSHLKIKLRMKKWFR